MRFLWKCAVLLFIHLCSDCINFKILGLWGPVLLSIIWLNYMTSCVCLNLKNNILIVWTLFENTLYNISNIFLNIPFPLFSSQLKNHEQKSPGIRSCANLFPICKDFNIGHGPPSKFVCTRKDNIQTQFNIQLHS